MVTVTIFFLIEFCVYCLYGLIRLEIRLMICGGQRKKVNNSSGGWHCVRLRAERKISLGGGVW